MTTTVRIVGDAQRLRVVAGAPEVQIKGHASVQRDERTITVTAPRAGLVVNVPTGTDVVIGSQSGSVATIGDLGSVSITSASGRVEVDRAANVDVRADSSRVTVGSVSATCRVRSRSGRVVVESCGVADVSTRSGRIDLRRVDGDVVAHSVSGRVMVALAGAHDVRAETVSGRIVISVPAGMRTFVPTPGDPAPMPPDPDCCVVHATSTSGRVVLRST